MFIAPLTYNYFFQKVFSNEEIAKAFIQDFLEVKVEEFQFLRWEHKITDKAYIIKFDFRCKIDGQYLIIEMQQWYKLYVIKRFYVYHALSSVLQLENLQTLINPETGKKEIKDYREMLPVTSIIWMVHDTLGFEEEIVNFKLTPSMVTDFLKNENLWKKGNWKELTKRRESLLKVVNNRKKDLQFLQENQLIFAFQKNILKSPKLKSVKYQWFDFAEKTRNQKNTKSDFTLFKGNKTFEEIMRILAYDTLSEEERRQAYLLEERGFINALLEEKKQEVERMEKEVKRKKQEVQEQEMEMEKKKQEVNKREKEIDRIQLLSIRTMLNFGIQPIEIANKLQISLEFVQKIEKELKN